MHVDSLLSLRKIQVTRINKFFNHINYLFTLITQLITFFFILAVIAIKNTHIT